MTSFSLFLSLPLQATTASPSEEELRQQLESLRQLLAEQETLISDLEAEKLDRPVHPEVSRLREVVAELEEENKRLSEKTDETQVDSNELEEMETRLDTKSDSIHILQEQLDERHEELEHYRELSQKREDELQSMESELEEIEELDAQQAGDFMQITLEEAILFEGGEADLKEAAHPTLNRFIEIADTYSEYVVQVEGHTDDVPLSAGHEFDSNWELSAARAVNVVRYIEDNSEIDMERVVAAGYGPHQPLVPNDSPENRRKNRRVEISLYPPEFLEDDPEGAVTPDEDILE